MEIADTRARTHFHTHPVFHILTDPPVRAFRHLLMVFALQER